MSLCRFGERGSDVYVFYHVEGGIECCGCRLETGFAGNSFRAQDEQEMISHLLEHKAKGHCVPPSVFGLLDEALKTFPGK